MQDLDELAEDDDEGGGLVETRPVLSMAEMSFCRSTMLWKDAKRNDRIKNSFRCRRGRRAGKESGMSTDLVPLRFYCWFEKVSKLTLPNSRLALLRVVCFKLSCFNGNIFNLHSDLRR